MLIALAIGLLIVGVRGVPSLRAPRPLSPYRPLLSGVGTPLLLAMSIVQLTNAKFTPLIYFKF